MKTPAPIVIRSNDQTLTLSTEEARELWDRLANPWGRVATVLEKNLAKMILDAGRAGGRCHNWQYLADNEKDAA